jgi:hypothetical protein
MANLRNACRCIDRRRLDADTRIEVPHHRHHARIHQLLRHGLAGSRIGLVVHRHHLQGDTLALNAEIGLVQFVDGQLHAIEQILAQCAERAAQRLRDTDLDAVGDIAATREQATCGPGCQGQTSRKTAPVQWLDHAENSVG